MGWDWDEFKDSLDTVVEFIKESPKKIWDGAEFLAENETFNSYVPVAKWGEALDEKIDDGMDTFRRFKAEKIDGMIDVGNNKYEKRETIQKRFETQEERITLEDRRIKQEKKELENENERIKAEKAKLQAMEKENEAKMRRNKQEERRNELEMKQLFSEKDRILANHPRKMAYFGAESYEVVGKIIGQGGFGHVDLVKQRNSGITIARKILSHIESLEKFLSRECMLFYLEHENILKFIGHTKLDVFHGILVEYMEGGSLDEIIPKIATEYSLNDVISWNLQSASALEYLHSFPYLHRDVKPGNMLLDKTHKILKLGDFGCAKAIADSVNTSRVGTLRYAAPEVLLNQNYREASDVYSWTLTFWQCCTGETPFNDQTQVLMCAKKGNSNYRLGTIENASEEFNRMIELSSAFDASLRLPMSSIRVLLEDLQNSIHSDCGKTIEELKSMEGCVYISDSETGEFYYSNKTFKFMRIEKKKKHFVDSERKLHLLP